jgi:hypothetical protein
MGNLRELYLDDNELTTLPDLPSNIEVLHLNGNRFKILPPSIWNLKLLRVLKVDRNPELVIKSGGQEIPCPQGIRRKDFHYLKNLDTPPKLLESRYQLYGNDEKGRLAPSELPHRAQVFTAFDFRSGHHVTIKKIQISRQKAEAFLKFQRFPFQDDNLITYIADPLITFERDQFSLYLITECFHQTLFDIIHDSDEDRSLKMLHTHAKDFMIQLAGAVFYLHENNLKHCRLTSHSFAAVQTAQGFLFKLMDSDWARYWNPTKKTGDKKEEVPQESTGYLPPEVEYPEKYGPITFASDVFSLGMIFFEIVTRANLNKKVVRGEGGEKRKYTDIAKDLLMPESVKGDFQNVLGLVMKKNLTFASPFQAMIFGMVNLSPTEREPQRMCNNLLIRINAVRY